MTASPRLMGALYLLTSSVVSSAMPVSVTELSTRLSGEENVRHPPPPKQSHYLSLPSRAVPSVHVWTPGFVYSCIELEKITWSVDGFGSLVPPKPSP